jgi:DNA-binding CsgD family transcriptional regulator
MGEMIALQSLRTIKRHYLQIADKLYIGLIKDLHHMREVDYIISEGYDLAQTAICFLWQFVGRSVYEICGKDKKGTEITIKLACYREVGRYVDRLRRKATHTDYIDFTDYKALPVDPVDHFEKEEQDYDKADAILNAMQLSEIELTVLNCYMNGMVQSQVSVCLGLNRGRINYRKKQVRQKYLTYVGDYCNLKALNTNY